MDDILSVVDIFDEFVCRGLGGIGGGGESTMIIVALIITSPPKRRFMPSQSSSSDMENPVSAFIAILLD